MGCSQRAALNSVNNNPNPFTYPTPSHIPHIICILHTTVNMTEQSLIRQNECSSITVSQFKYLSLFGMAACVAHTMNIFRERCEDSVAQLKQTNK